MAMPELRLSSFVANLETSTIVALFTKVADKKSKGEVINGALCAGQPDFPPPPEVVQATGEAAAKGITAYTGLAGTLELRQAICQYLKNQKGVHYVPEEIVVSGGGKQSLFQVLMSLCQAGDEVIIPAPYWTSYLDDIKLTGAKPIILETTAESGFKVDPASLEKVITKNTRMLILNNPSNPTGATMNRAQQEAVADVLRRPENANIWVISDEIYECITYDGVEHVSFAALEGMRERTLTVNGFSKAFAMTGYRLGYLAAPKPVAEVCLSLQSQINTCASSISQHAGVAALRTSRQYIEEKVAELKVKRDMALGLLGQIPGVVCQKPGGAFYLFPDISAYFGRKAPSGQVLKSAWDICVYLLDEHKVALVPGEAFGAPRCLRISYAATHEDIKDGISKLGKCLTSLVANSKL